jgi:hypothetical protein
VKPLTTSRMKCFRRCQRLHRYRYIDGYSLVADDENLSIGKAVHRGLERWFNGGSGHDSIMLAVEDLEPFHVAVVECMLAGYFARWPCGALTPVAVEREFVTKLVNPETGRESRTWNLAGKIDAVVFDEADGRHKIVEHKTTGEDVGPGSEYWKRLRIDGQVSTYYAGARSLGYDIDSCIYDVLKKPSLKPLKMTPPESRKYTKDGRLYASQRAEDETSEEFKARVAEAIAAEPDRYYSRGTVVRLASEMEEFQLDTWDTAKQMHEAESAGRYPRNPDSCNAYGRTCEFFPVCTGETTLQDSRYKKLETVNPELGAIP